MKFKSKDNFNIMLEAYKNIRTSIEFGCSNKNIKTILITSSKADEGKSTVLCNIAKSFADMNKKVLVIDADLRNPSIHKIYNISNNIGLTDVIEKDKLFEDCINKDLDKNVNILTSGTIIENPVELIASDNMRTFINDVKEEYDYIFIDAPPIGVVTEASILSSMVDSVILVVASNEVDKKLLEISKNRLTKFNANILGVIFNKYNSGKNSYYYGCQY